MKLYEFSSLVTVATVIAAESEKIARKRLREFSTEKLVNLSDIVDVTSIDLFDVRNSTLEKLSDEAHDVVEIKDCN